MASLTLVEGMTEQPGTCLACGGTPTNYGGHPKPAINLGVEVNWGETAYLCEECCHVIADLYGRVTEDAHELVESRNKLLVKQNKKLTAKNIELKNDLEALEKAEEVRKRRAK